MNNEEKILELLQQMNSRMEHIEKDVAELKVDVAELKEKQELMNESIGYILEWADDVHRAKDFPIPRIG